MTSENKVSGKPMRLYVVTRGVTGRGYCHHAYVRNQDTQKVLAYCEHAHRNLVTAQRCGEKMYRRVVRTAKEES